MRLAPPFGYALAVFLLTFPVWGHPTTRWIGGPGDPMKFVEFLGWYPFAISHGLNPLMNSYINLPTGTSMMWDTTMPLPAIVLWPATATLGAIASYNVAVVASLVLDGWCTYLWLRGHVERAAAAWLGGLFMVLGPFAVARVHGHLNLLMFFPVPLIFKEVERLVTRSRPPRLAGAVIGLLAAVQLLCCEEVLALLTVVLVSVAFIKAFVDRLPLVLFVRHAVRGVPCAASVFILITGVPLAFQLFGPGRIAGKINPPNVYVTDAVNLVVPGSFNALAPHFAGELASRWSGNLFENDSYVGLPLLCVAAIVLVAWRRERWVRTIGLATLSALVLSLGPSLHFDGIWYLAPLPGAALASLPVLKDLLDVRFDLFTEFGLAALLAVFVDRTVLAGDARERLVAGAAVLLVAASIAPELPVPAYQPKVPQYFTGDVSRLRQGTVALVVPFGDSERTMAPMAWQAVAHFRFRMVAGAALTAGVGGSVTFGATGNALDCAMARLQSGRPPELCGPGLVPAVRADLRSIGVSLVVLGPFSYQAPCPFCGPPVPPSPVLTRRLTAFMDTVTASSPHYEQGVLIWNWQNFG